MDEHMDEHKDMDDDKEKISAVITNTPSSGASGIIGAHDAEAILTKLDQAGYMVIAKNVLSPVVEEPEPEEDSEGESPRARGRPVRKHK